MDQRANEAVIKYRAAIETAANELKSELKKIFKKGMRIDAYCGLRGPKPGGGGVVVGMGKTPGMIRIKLDSWDRPGEAEVGDIVICEQAECEQAQQ